MTLLDKSLKLALLAGAFLLTACPPKGGETGLTEGDADADTDADTDTDTTGDGCDTGITQFEFVGDFATTAGEFDSAHFGYGFYGISAGDWICTITGDLPYEGAAPAGCPDCDWSFDLGAAENSVAEGDFCDAFGITDGYLDGYVDYAWGFASTYYYDYNGTPLAFENNIMLYYDGWFDFAFNYGGRDWVSGDASSAEFARPVFDGSSYVYYYYYPNPEDCY